MMRIMKYILPIFLTIILNLLIFILGGGLFVFPDKMGKLIELIFIIGLFAKSVGEFWAYFVVRDMNSKSRLYQGIGFLSVALLILINTNLRLISLSLLLSGLFLADAVLKLFISIQYKKSGLANWWHTLIMSIISALLVVVIFFSPNHLAIVRLAGIFICWQALSTIVDIIVRGQDWKNMKRHWQIRFLYIQQRTYDNSFLPARIFAKIEQQVQHRNDISQFIDKTDKKMATDLPNDETLQVTIHSWDGDIMTMKGHSDFIFENRCYSYGNYDADAHYLGGNLSDGVIVVADAEPYIQYCLEKEKKALIQYTLRITQVQKEKLRRLLSQFQDKQIAWYPPILLDATADDDASRLYQAIQPAFYKIKSGEFKYYFVLNTNCIRFVGYVLNQIGFKDLPATGLLTPGDYLDFFEKKLENPADYDIIERKVMVNIKDKEGNEHE